MAVAAAPFAAFVMDARTGKEIYAQNADTRLHPASLTKMMTLYMAFSAIERGQVRLDSKFLVSSHAAAQPPSRLGLKAGQRIELRYLIRAAAVKSANDAATVIGEGLAGSEPKFAQQMTQMARALGMRNTNFRNANGLTAEGHYSTARDMSTLGRRLFYDFPQYYSLFSRRSADAGITTVSSTNKRFLDSYEGADGIKTGYTRAAGFNLTASAKRGSKRIVATVLGGNSTAHRNQVMAQLLDAGFGKAPTRVREVKPAPPQFVAERKVRRSVQVAQAAAPAAAVRLSSSQRPVARASTVAVVTPAAISAAVQRAQAATPPAAASAAPGRALAASARPARKPEARRLAAAAEPELLADAARPEARPEEGDASETAAAPMKAPRPLPAPRGDRSASLAAPSAGSPSLFVQTAVPQPESMALLAAPPTQRSETIILAALEPADDADPQATEIVARDAAGGGGNWGLSLGLFRSQSEAQQVLLKTALQESGALGNAPSRVANTQRGFEANFTGMSRESAQLACDRIAARQQSCRVFGP
ncbi:D-alanyl-D-alanine carboxypeptidase [Paracoccus thiocyanatus]|uniref:D-alanyl-D-alanine carboxypeptidase n=4 Tax=Paracoccus thiocyanatus TaxID=34006 RepID=A0A1N6YRB6_9RHOB|nr:D-alanyl-D-alanine carboxypeptidase [Paracoccus thiocyanatus]